MANKTDNPSLMPEEMKRLEQAKNLLDQQIKKNRASSKFLLRYKQDLDIVFANPEFLKMVKEIRNLLAIPAYGFDATDGTNNFRDWLEKYKEENGFYKFGEIMEVLKKFLPLVKTDPAELLEFFVDAVIRDTVNAETYYQKDNFIFLSPSLEIYENYVNEKPFPGIFNFILFNDILIPHNNMTAVFDYENHIVMAISANTTKRDLMELWPTINKWQKEMPSNIKNKKRLKKNLKKGLDTIKFDKKTIEDSKNKTKEEQKVHFARRLYEDLDNRFIKKDTTNFDFSEEKKARQNRRKIKSRTKKLLGPK